jgi:hypothetical protein
MCCDDNFNELISQLIGKGNKINLWELDAALLLVSSLPTDGTGE